MTRAKLLSVLIGLWLGLAALLMPGVATAQSCFVNPDPEVDFGQVANTPTPQIDSTGTLRITCFGSVPNQRVKVCARLANGTPDASLLPQRRMANGADRLNYQIYSDAARTQVWGSGGATPAAEAIVTLNQPFFFGIHFGQVDLQLYGRLQGGQSGLAAGNYQSRLNGSEITASTNLGRSCNAPATVADTFSATVRASLSRSCTIEANNLDFGVRNRLDTAAVDASTTLGVTCTVDTPYTVRLDGGTTTGDVAGRQMALNGSGAGVIGYELRHTSANGPLWGDGTGGTGVVNGTGTGGSQTLPVYGRVPVQATPAVGYYEDTVTVTVQY